MLVPKASKALAWLFVEQIELNLVKWFWRTAEITERLGKNLNWIFFDISPFNFFLIEFNHLTRCIELTSSIKVCGFTESLHQNPERRWIRFRFVASNWLWIELKKFHPKIELNLKFLYSKEIELSSCSKYSRDWMQLSKKFNETHSNFFLASLIPAVVFFPLYSWITRFLILFI